MQWNLVYLAGIVPAAAFVVSVFFLTDWGPKDSIDLSSPDTHVIITGGSSGIGLATAIKLRQKGCSVTIIARDESKLHLAKQEIDTASIGRPGSLSTVSADVGNREQIETAIKKCCEPFNGHVHVLIASAGVSRPGRVDETSTAMYESMIRINYLGALYSALAVLPMMKAQRSGRLIFISSLAGLAGMIGFAGYSPSKFAVRGLAEALHMELRPWGIYTSLVNPPDVDTPMLAEEMQWKPEETKILSEGGGLLTAEQIASPIVHCISSWKFMVNPGFDGWLLGLLSTDLSTPCPGWGRAMLEILLAGPLRFVSLVYLTMWNRVCSQVHQKNHGTCGSTSAMTHV